MNSILIQQAAIGILIAILSIIFVKFLLKLIKDVVYLYRQRKEFKKRMKVVEDMKANGEFHEWLYTNVEGHETHVCAKTGYCPRLGGFLSMEQIQEIKTIDKLDKAYKAFRTKEMARIAKVNGLSKEEIEKIHNEIGSIRLDFMQTEMLQMIKKEMNELTRSNEKDKE